jgi:protein-S-isoprenylcysteine O-methyltransferase Ste14
MESTYRTLFWILLAGLMAMRGYFSVRVLQARERLMPDRKAIEREGQLLFAARVAGFFLLLILLVSYALDSSWLAALSIPLSGRLRWKGFALGLASLIFWTWTQVSLGKQWSGQLQLRAQHQLVTTGPYACVRHPLYTALSCWIVGLALLTANWAFVLLAAAVIALLVTRTPKEEQMMMKEFGEQYKAYSQRTARFFPKLR